jgi:hypothetical protein
MSGLRLDMVMEAHINEQPIVLNIGRDAFELQCLESSPPQQRRMGRDGLAEVLCEVFVCG